ncbi:MAG: hypothetical protein K9L98_00140 [Candidatus Pacebacteria bacterium]|nr:hypothetical protein [Candidatus Paceibacterota bacterium]MCF7862413.1 hypothetical protein [Candidatus Paceibacterota bacterium]
MYDDEFKDKDDEFDPTLGDDSDLEDLDEDIFSDDDDEDEEEDDDFSEGFGEESEK